MWCIYIQCTSGLKYVGMVVIWPLARGKPSNSFQNKVVETGAVYRQSGMYGDNA